MKRYWLFVSYTYYPLGGIHDLVDSYDTLAEIDALKLHEDGVMARLNKPTSIDDYDSWHVLDTASGMIVIAHDHHLFEKNATLKFPMTIQQYTSITR